MRDLDPRKIPWRKICAAVLVLVIVLALAAALRSWYRKPSVVTTTQYVTVPQEKIVEKIRTVTIPGPERIVTIEKQVIVDRLKLPQEIAKDDAQQIIANADLAGTKSGYSVCAVMNTKTGVSRIIAKEKTQPFFALVNERELGGRFGYSTDGTVVDIYGRWTFARMGSVYLAGYAGASSHPDPAAKAMIDLSYRW